MSPLRIQTKYYESKRLLLLVKPLLLSNEKIKVFSSIACNSMIALNKQRQDPKNLATTQREKFKGAHECSKSLEFVN